MGGRANLSASPAGSQDDGQFSRLAHCAPMSWPGEREEIREKFARSLASRLLLGSWPPVRPTDRPTD